MLKFYPGLITNEGSVEQKASNRMLCIDLQ